MNMVGTFTLNYFYLTKYALINTLTCFPLPFREAIEDWCDSKRGKEPTLNKFIYILKAYYS